MLKRFIVGSGFLATMVATAIGQCPNITCNQAPHTGRQVNIAGATLLRDFFRTTAHVNDFVDVNGDGCFGFNNPPCTGLPPRTIDTLAPSGNFSYWWIVQNRAVGSVEGFVEFINYQLCCDIPDALVTDESRINSQQYASGAGPGGTFSGCTQDNDADGQAHGLGNPNGTGTPICPCTVDVAIIDVPSLWASQGPAGSNAFSRKPGQSGYGINPNPSIPVPGVGCSTAGAFLSELASLTRAPGGICPGGTLNANTSSPDGNTLFDFAFTAAPVVPIANRGTGLQNVTYTDLRYLLVSGRMPSGENIAAGTRDAGSGTRNAWCNSLGIDPAWGNGDNRGARTSGSTGVASTNLGPCHRMTNCGSSSHVENATQQRRMGLGYTGIAGSTAAAADAIAGLYEVLNVTNDINGGTLPVRPTVTTIVDNDTVNAGYRITGPGTFTTRGDIDVSSPVSPNYNPALPQAMANEDAADYLYNIRESIDSFVANPGTLPDQLMPGQFLANTFFLLAGLDARQSVTDPIVFNPQTPNGALRAYILANNNLGTTSSPNGVITPDFGSRNEAGKVPNRGSNYSYRNSGGTVFSIAQGTDLSIRNRVAGDFLYDELRNCNDIPKMMAAIAAGRDGGGVSQYFENPVPPLPGGAMDDPGLSNNDASGNNLIIVDVMGDLNGDGTFDAADVRYFADGTAIDPGTLRLNRECGFTAVDNAWALLPGGDNNYFDTTIVDPCGNSRPYTVGASRFDVAGSTTGPAKGDNPIGANGVVDEADYCYVWANFGSWTSLSDASEIDLSCDMNGDLVVDQADARALVELGWGRCFGDLNCDGAVDISDLALMLSSFGTVGGVTYNDGDLNCDGEISIGDLALLLSSFGGIFPGC